jgi:hypothetical protein
LIRIPVRRLAEGSAGYRDGSGSRALPSRAVCALSTGFLDLIQISKPALREGCDRASDLFLLNRLRAPEDAGAGLEGTYQALGIDPSMREELQEALTDLVPVKGLPAMEAVAVGSMLAGVLVGLLIADSALPAEELDLPVLPSR